MSILSIQTDFAGQVGLVPRRPKMLSTDSLAAITAPGYMQANNTTGILFSPTDVIDCIYNYVASTNTGSYVQLFPSISNGLTTLNSIETIAASVSSATPGTVRALVGSMTSSASVMTSGNIVGVRGAVNYVGASGGFIYGTQGKIIPTGTLSGSSWNAGVFGQVDISQATINAGQIAPIWGDYGATSGTISDATGMYGIAMTNTTAATLEAQIYLYGKATNLLQLNGSSATYISAGGAGAPGGTIKKLAISIDGVTYYIIASTAPS